MLLKKKKQNIHESLKMTNFQLNIFFNFVNCFCVVNARENSTQ